MGAGQAADPRQPDEAPAPILALAPGKVETTTKFVGPGDAVLLWLVTSVVAGSTPVLLDLFAEGAFAPNFTLAGLLAKGDLLIVGVVALATAAGQLVMNGAQQPRDSAFTASHKSNMTPGGRMDRMNARLILLAVPLLMLGSGSFAVIRFVASTPAVQNILHINTEFVIWGSLGIFIASIVLGAVCVRTSTAS